MTLESEAVLIEAFAPPWRRAGAHCQRDRVAGRRLPRLEAGDAGGAVELGKGTAVMTGTLFGVGVGPGDPELLTLKALRLIRQSPVIAWPAPLEGESFARSIVAQHLRAEQTEIAIRVPMRADRHPAREVV